MTAKEAIAYFHSVPKFPKQPGLFRMRGLMHRLGNPHQFLRFIHIAGTNGKGSTAAMTAAILTEAGYRTGLFTSPYLECFQERIKVDGAFISETDLVEVTMQVKTAVQAMVSAGEEPPTEFELVTAAGFLYFLKKACDFVVLETGLGGRFDATNIIAPPIVAAITSISKDHTRVLGDDLAAIAGEKCGILKEGSRAVTTPYQAAEAMQVICSHCDAHHIPLLVPKLVPEKQIALTLSETAFEWEGQQYRIPLLGRHQISNALVSLGIIQILREEGIHVLHNAVQNGLMHVKWNGRLEFFSHSPDIVLDTAHNLDGISALCEALDYYFPGKRIITLMGMLSDKSYGQCAKAVASRSDIFFAVAPPEPKRAVSAEEFASTARPYCLDVREKESVGDALDSILEQTNENTVVIICGSIPLVGEARTYLKQKISDTACSH